mmetsp:Transcript_3207/g.13914  ORF Transcript_3207/g.13914 Transcript_3207/m.13914 type:complete len:335 (-) Transcript_3207:79-1083(-)
MSDLLPSDPASWRRHAAHALASFASPAAQPAGSNSSNLATPPRSAISLQMSSFTATCLRAAASEAHRPGSSDASTRVSETHKADAAPALANALACVNAPDAGSRGSSPVVRALTAAHAWRSACASEAASTNTATSGVSTPALMNAPLHASFLVQAAATTAQHSATDFGCVEANAGQSAATKFMGWRRETNVSLPSSHERTSASVCIASATSSEEAPAAPSATRSHARQHACTAPAPTHADPQPGVAPSPETHSRSARAVSAMPRKSPSSTAASCALAAAAAGCSPRPSGPAYVLSICERSTPCSSNSFTASSTASSGSISKSSMLPWTHSSKAS